MRKIIAFDWRCSSDEYMEDIRNFPITASTYNDITVIENPEIENRADEPYVTQVFDPSYNNYIQFHFLVRPGFIFNDKTYLRFDNSNSSMSDVQFIRHVYYAVIEHLKDQEKAPEICNLEDIIF